MTVPQGDLSHDPVDIPESLPEVHRDTEVSLAAKQWEHATTQQKSAVSAAIAFAALLYISAIATVLCVAGLGGATSPHFWHVSAVSSGFLIAGTVIVLVVVRAVHPDEAVSRSSNNEDTKTVIHTLKDLTATSTEMLSSVAGLVKKLADR